MSDQSVIVNAIVRELQDNVAGLDSDSVSAEHLHRYSRQDPEKLKVGTGRELAVYPVQELNSELNPDRTTGGVILTQAFEILIWEPSGEGRGKSDEDAAKDFLDLQNAVRDRVLGLTLAGAAGSYLCRYGGTEWPSTPSLVRAVQLVVLFDLPRPGGI